jgi:hypothetical protein
LLDDPDAYAAMQFSHNPYGDGHASDYILAAIRQWWAEQSYGARGEVVQAEEPVREARLAMVE